MFARRALRRAGVGLVGATVTGAGVYDAGSSAAWRSAQQAPPQSSSPGLTDENMDQLRKLSEMKKEGILTYEEFEAQKQRLLS